MNNSQGSFINENLQNNINKHKDCGYLVVFAPLSRPGYILCLMSSILGICAGIGILSLSFIFISITIEIDHYGGNYYEKLNSIVDVIWTFILACILFALHITIIVFASKNLKNPPQEKHLLFIAILSIILGFVYIIGFIGAIFILIEESRKKQISQQIK